MGGRARWLRVIAGLLAGAAVTVAPYVYYWRTDWHQLQTSGLPYLTVLLGPMATGGFVAALIAHRRPRWWIGGLLGLVLGVVTAVLFLRAAGDVPSEWWWLLLLGAVIAISAGLGGAFGGALGWLVAKALTGAPADAEAHSVKPWQVGAALAAIMVVVFGVLAAVL